MADIWDAAIEEARASATVDQFELETIELLHPAFVGEDDLPDSIRLVLDEQDWNLELEAAAPLRGGETVAFQRAAMRVVFPEQAEGQISEVRLSFDFVSREFLPWIDAALSIRADARLIVRTWLTSRNMATGVHTVSGPPLEILSGLTVREIRGSAASIELKASFKDLVNVGWPRRLFTQSDFPGLF